MHGLVDALFQVLVVLHHLLPTAATAMPATAPAVIPLMKLVVDLYIWQNLQTFKNNRIPWMEHSSDISFPS